MPIPSTPDVKPLLLAVALALLAAPAAQAQAAAPAAAPAASSPRDTAVIERLGEVGRFLRAQKHFIVRAEAVKDEVLENGQKLQFTQGVEYQVSTPDKLRATLRSDRIHRDFYFDGKTLTQVAVRAGYYASVPMPGTITEAIVGVAERYEIEMPLADLFLWGTPKGGLDDVTAALKVGPARINGVDCDHFALRQSGVDWQVWVERGVRALPQKLVITTTDEPAQPQYAATLKWSLGTTPAAGGFTYTPTKGMNRIELKPVAAAK